MSSVWLNRVQHAYLSIADLYTAANMDTQYTIAPGSETKIIDLSSYSSGMYTISLICDGQVLDSKTFVKY